MAGARNNTNHSPDVPQGSVLRGIQRLIARRPRGHGLIDRAESEKHVIEPRAALRGPSAPDHSEFCHFRRFHLPCGRFG